MPAKIGTTRRRVLASLGSIGAMSTLAGCGSSGGAPIIAPSGNGNQTGTGNNSTDASNSIVPPPVNNPAQYAGAFETVVDIVNDAGADPTGETDISPIVRDVLDDDTLVVFPQGRYKMNSQVRRTGLRNVGIIGQGAVLTHGRVDAIHGFEVTDGEFSGKAQHFKIGVPSRPHEGRFVFGGFILDWREPNTGIQLINHHTNGTSVIENIRQMGIHDLGCQGPVRVNAYSPDSKAIVRGLDLRYGGKTYQHTINTRAVRGSGGLEDGRSLATSGLTTFPEAKGHLRVLNSACGGWPDNGLYVAGGDEQRVEVINCVAVNSHASNIRIAGQDCRIHNCFAGTDSDFGKSKFYFEQRPIRLDGGSCTVTNTQIKQLHPTGWSVTVQGGMDHAVLKNIYVEIHNQQEYALVIDDEVGYCEVDTFEIVTHGWKAMQANVLRGFGDKMTNMTLNGRSIA